MLSLDCGALQESRVVTSRGPEVTVTLWGQGQALFPHRGALVEFTGEIELFNANTRELEAF